MTMSSQTISQSTSQNRPTTKLLDLCSYCKVARHLCKSGLIHQHGPRGNICPGSNKPPLATQSAIDDSCTTQQSLDETRILSDSQSPSNTVSEIPHPVFKTTVIKHIPKGARTAVAHLLTVLLDKICSSPTRVENWIDLLNVGHSLLYTPPRGGKRNSLTSIIKRRVTVYQEASAEDEIHPPMNIPRQYRKKSSSSASPHWLRVVSSKLEDGNIRAALRILCSDDSLVNADVSSLEELRSKHPEPPDNDDIPSPDIDVQPLQVTDSDILREVRSFPSGSTGGPDGIRPQHILELVNHSDTGPALISSLTNFINLLLRGDCPDEVRPALFGGTLMALRKKTGGLRPIAIGYYWRRLASKCANSFAISQVVERIAPLQLGIGIPGGCEAAVHSARRFLEELDPDSALVKLDFTNAFNSLSRSAMLRAVLNATPAIYRYCHAAYAKTSTLKFGQFSLQSQTGAQQGDPLGPFLFCMAIQPMLERLSSELRIGFLDDLTIGGTIPDVARDVKFLSDEANKIGLSLNIKKCEIISNKTVSALPEILSQFLPVPRNEACLLGAPLTTGIALSRCLEYRRDELALGISRIKDLPRHDALTLLRCSINSSRMLYTLRCAPCMDHPTLIQFDELLRTGLSQVLNLNLSAEHWLQATLPIRDGGLGIRRSASLALPAFLASAAGTARIQTSILANTAIPEDTHLSAAMTRWSSECNEPDIVAGESLRKQSSWDRPLVERECLYLKSTITSDFHQARLNAVTMPHSGDWLLSLPITALGLRLDDEAIRIATGLRLGVDLCAPHICCCGAHVTSDGTHGLSCRLGPGRIARHAALNDIIWRALSRAGIPSRKEPVGLTRSDGKRPDGQTLIPWENGRCLTWDVTVIDTLAGSYRALAAQSPGGPSELAATRKNEKYENALPNYAFVPLAFETLGPINNEGLTFIRRLGHLLSQLSGDKRETSFLRQLISVTIQRFNAVAFHGTFPPVDQCEEEERFNYATQAKDAEEYDYDGHNPHGIYISDIPNLKTSATSTEMVEEDTTDVLQPATAEVEEAKAGGEESQEEKEPENQEEVLISDTKDTASRIQASRCGVLTRMSLRTRKLTDSQPDATSSFSDTSLAANKWIEEHPNVSPFYSDESEQRMYFMTTSTGQSGGGSCVIQLQTGARISLIMKSDCDAQSSLEEAKTLRTKDTNLTLEELLGCIYCEKQIVSSSDNACEGEENGDEGRMITDDFTQVDYYKDDSEALKKPLESLYNEEEFGRFAHGGNPSAIRTLLAVMKSLNSSEGKFGASGFSRGDTLFIWDVRLTDFERKSQLAQDPLTYSTKFMRETAIALEMKFQDTYPLTPPFVAVTRPRFKFLTGHVTIGGSICMEMLTRPCRLLDCLKLQ